MVLEVGGFLGIGGRLVADTSQSLVVEEDGSTLRIKLLGGSREALEKTTEFRYPTQSQNQQHNQPQTQHNQPQTQQNQPQGQSQQPKQ